MKAQPGSPLGTGCAEAVSYAAASDRVARLVLASPVVYPDPHELRIAS
ncbi:hypothetical protein ACIBI9_61140 [Nonomuraea sp. NPDC050451]